MSSVDPRRQSFLKVDKGGRENVSLARKTEDLTARGYDLRLHLFPSIPGFLSRTIFTSLLFSLDRANDFNHLSLAFWTRYH